ncbi:hypothetical protein AAFC00_002008 [Neodothiora populina]|uniref:Peroxisomal membrane protein PEX14 n=1 Tax=Neodothiora populina TaxID=2781224 RepID=A0ABR3PFZ2_9PEZI
MADRLKPRPAIPAWQRAQQPLTPAETNSKATTNMSDPDQVGAAPELEADSHGSSGHSRVDPNISRDAAEQGHDASETAPKHTTGNAASDNTPSTDGSDVAARQEFEASKETPSSPTEPDQAPNNAATTDGSDIAAKQEFDASKTVIDQVRQFLNDPGVKGEPTEKKCSFLVSKGVSRDIIDEVLADSVPSSFSPSEFQNSSAKQSPAPVLPKDIPPIVTYPEFLVQPQKPPPLVTVSRLLCTAYITGGLAATIYGLSQFLIAPMTENLTEARHDFASHTSSGLTKITERLSGLVSEVPTTTKPKAGLDNPDDVDNDDDAESTVSDPTELFHRDIGTQTSSLPSPGDDSSSSSLGSPETTLTKQETRLKILHSHLDELLQHSETNGSTNEDMHNDIADFRQSLDDMIYSPPSYQFTNDSAYTLPGSNTPRGADKKDDAVAAFKAEIRGVKGVLLSAKRFPPATAVR